MPPIRSHCCSLPLCVHQHNTNNNKIWPRGTAAIIPIFKYSRCRRTPSPFKMSNAKCMRHPPTASENIYLHNLSGPHGMARLAPPAHIENERISYSHQILKWKKNKAANKPRQPDPICCGRIHCEWFALRGFVIITQLKQQAAYAIFHNNDGFLALVDAGDGRGSGMCDNTEILFIRRWE